MFFVITKRQNYTLGYRQCKNVSALPVDVTSEQRTDALAQLLASSSIDMAFVGLRSKNGSAFISVNGEYQLFSDERFVVKNKFPKINSGRNVKL